ncbi:MAG: Maf family protein [Terriglobales bacterium]|jgi:septum formation protein
MARVKVPAIILASASPRRAELLRSAAIPFTVDVANIAEDLHRGEKPAEHAERLAREKAEVVAKRNPGKLVLGADTIVVVDDEILGKPRDAADAARMLRMLSGRPHEVITAVCVARLAASNQQLATCSEQTKVFFQEIAADEIETYVATREPMDKAGAYAIQGIASRWINKIEGDYANVVGLPVALVWKMLQKFPNG